jgi:glycosyltransferase involved in cell wall biosynthesis
MKICALVPAYNEASYIADVVQGARRHVEEVVVSDDGSRDGTAEIAQAAGAIVLRSPSNRGKASALRTAIQFAAARDFSHVVTLDGDGQHCPEDIPALVEAAQQTGADLVIGTRTFDRAAMPVARYYSNTLGSRIASALVGHEIRDSQCGFRMLRMDKLRSLHLRSRLYEFEMEVLIKIARTGGRIAEAPVRTVYEGGHARSKMNPVRDTVRICLWSLAFRYLKA